MIGSVTLYTNTLPWADNGARILPAANYWAYTQAQRDLKETFAAEVRSFCAGYREHLAEARSRLNGLFVEADYPDPAEIDLKFAYRTGFSPLPAAEDFRVALGEGEQVHIRAQIETRLNEAAEAAGRDLWERIHKAVSCMRNRLDLYAVDPVSGKAEHPFRDSLVENLRDLVELLPRLNMTGDPALETMRRRLAASLCGHDPQDLRDDGALRARTARSAEAILDDMAGSVAPAAAE